MPTITVTAPRGAVEDQRKASLMRRLSDTLLKYEGAALDNPLAQEIAWTYFHEVPEGHFFVGGKPSSATRIKIDVTTPEGQLNDVSRLQLTQAIEQILKEEVGSSAVGLNHWVLFHEVAEGHWGTSGRIFRRSEIIAAVRGKGVPAV